PQKPRIQPKPPLTPSVLTPNLPLLSTPPPSPTPYIISLLPGYQISIPNYLTILLPTPLITILMLTTFSTFVRPKEHLPHESQPL
ncbi:anaerobic C4-dicarboxylate transporter family protein, partial [Staphylococcus epidermidis]|uniref:anaerobic C4-dicarboxylate transporter family protein n=1 Tax=Staphylococcus epidermidis TaxID=1282 RepID=UPI0028CB734A